ncbi:hypothetical protein [Vibrio diabolicus]|uniref:hypothetical protein n=1 Tax=Vibrio diabolicus TaxID=50719 RepID=UPI002876ACA0|nr:hypothetical protein [Vibrio harveyi]
MRKLSGKLSHPNIIQIDQKGIQCDLVEIELDSKTVNVLKPENLANDIQFYHEKFQDAHIHFKITTSKIPDVIIDSLSNLTSYDGRLIVSHNQNTSADKPITVRKDLVKAINKFNSSSGWLWNPILNDWCNPLNDSV